MLDKGSFSLICLYVKMNVVYTGEFLDLWVYKHQAFRVLLNTYRRYSLQTLNIPR
jgi:hypothetical protein